MQSSRLFAPNSPFRVERLLRVLCVTYSIVLKRLCVCVCVCACVCVTYMYTVQAAPAVCDAHQLPGYWVPGVGCSYTVCCWQPQQDLPVYNPGPGPYKEVRFEV